MAERGCRTWTFNVRGWRVASAYCLHQPCQPPAQVARVPLEEHGAASMPMPFSRAPLVQANTKRSPTGSTGPPTQARRHSHASTAAAPRFFPREWGAIGVQLLGRTSDPTPGSHVKGREGGGDP